MAKFKHTTKVEGIELSHKKLAIKIGDLYYDSLAEFLDELSNKLYEDSVADDKRGRKQLANSLFEASKHISYAKEYIDKSWDISEPYMQKWFEEHGSNR